MFSILYIHELDLGAPLNNADHAGVVFFTGEYIMEIKKPLTVSQQVELLKSRGLLIENEAVARRFLQHINYYTLSGYLYAFKDGENFIKGTTMKKIQAIYQCDKRFKNIILYSLDEVEQNLKTKIAYTLAHKVGALCHEEPSNFKDAELFSKFQARFQNAVDNNHKIPFVKHHLTKYDGHFPIWVAVNLFTLGTLEHFFENLQTQYQKYIVKDFNLSVPIFSSWIHSISYLRNMAAHYMRLYDFKIQLTPLRDKTLKKFPKPTYRVFDIIYIMKYLYPNRDEWLYFILPSIEQTFEEYQEYIDIHSYGFSDNWKDLLKK